MPAAVKKQSTRAASSKHRLKPFEPIARGASSGGGLCSLLSLKAPPPSPPPSAAPVPEARPLTPPSQPDATPVDAIQHADGRVGRNDVAVLAEGVATRESRLDAAGHRASRTSSLMRLSASDDEADDAHAETSLSACVSLGMSGCMPSSAASLGARVSALKSSVSWALVCACNMNRSMSAHLSLRNNGFTAIKSFGTSDAVRLPSRNGPAAFTFGTEYRHMLSTLTKNSIDRAWLTRYGLHAMLERNAALKASPESWQLQSDADALSHDFIVCFDDAVYAAVQLDMNKRVAALKEVAAAQAAEAEQQRCAYATGLPQHAPDSAGPSSSSDVSAGGVHASHASHVTPVKRSRSLRQRTGSITPESRLPFMSAASLVTPLTSGSAQPAAALSDALRADVPAVQRLRDGSAERDELPLAERDTPPRCVPALRGILLAGEEEDEQEAAHSLEVLDAGAGVGGAAQAALPLACVESASRLPAKTYTRLHSSAERHRLPAPRLVVIMCLHTPDSLSDASVAAETAARFAKVVCEQLSRAIPESPLTHAPPAKRARTARVEEAEEERPVCGRPAASTVVTLSALPADEVEPILRAAAAQCKLSVTGPAPALKYTILSAPATVPRS